MIEWVWIVVALLAIADAVIVFGKPLYEYISFINYRKRLKKKSEAVLARLKR